MAAAAEVAVVMMVKANNNIERHIHGVISVSGQEQRSTVDQKPWPVACHRAETEASLHLVVD
jgi:hypothetical protein